MASPQWNPSTRLELISYWDIVICPTVSSTKKMSADTWNNVKNGDASGSFSSDGCAITYLRIVENNYIVVIATPLSEITQPVDKNKDAIDSAVMDLFTTIVTIILISLFLISILVYLIATIIGTELKKVDAMAKNMASNIGSEDLFEGIDLEAENEATCAYMAEIAMLKFSFLSMLTTLWNLRADMGKPPSIDNPLHEDADNTPEVLLNHRKALPGLENRLIISPVSWKDEENEEFEKAYNMKKIFTDYENGNPFMEKARNSSYGFNEIKANSHYILLTLTLTLTVTLTLTLTVTLTLTLTLTPTLTLTQTLTQTQTQTLPQTLTLTLTLHPPPPTDNIPRH